MHFFHVTVAVIIIKELVEQFITTESPAAAAAAVPWIMLLRTELLMEMIQYFGKVLSLFFFVKEQLFLRFLATKSCYSPILA